MRFAYSTADRAGLASSARRLRLQASQVIVALVLCAFATTAGAERIRILVQSSPLAGSQYYGLATLAAQMKAGDELQLAREPENKHDANAVLVLWRGQKLGYLPRRENRSVAKAMDEGLKLRATISRLRPEESDPWKRLEVAVQVEL
jgi:hypothetical protein